MRARVLEGGIVINVDFYNRASSEYVHIMGWDKELVEELYEWVEKQNAFKTTTPLTLVIDYKKWPPLGKYESKKLMPHIEPIRFALEQNANFGYHSSLNLQCLM